MGFAKSKGEASREKALKALSDFLRPEFIGRVDEIAVFNDLTVEDYEQIAGLMLGELVDPLQDRGIKLTWTKEVLESLAKEAIGGVRGARDLRNLIRRKVEDKIATEIVDRSEKAFSSVSLVLVNNEVSMNID